MVEKVRKGIIHYTSPNLLIASKGRKLYRSYNSGHNWKEWISLPVSAFEYLALPNRWTTRLTRKKVHHITRVTDDLFACVAFDSIYLIDEATGNINDIGNFKGSRPLSICAARDHLYYGVYTSNSERNPISIWSYNLEDRKWTKYHTFTDIRHIHGVFWDMYSDNLWITTGDRDHESSIIRFSNNGEPQKIITGSQQTRAVDLLFTEKYIHYATDAPHEPNYIYRMNRETKVVQQMQRVGGPVFWGRKEKDCLVFATVVEPTKVNRTDAVELWASCDDGSSWQNIKEFKKDAGHKKLFGYGQIKFPNGPGDGKNLWFTPYATEYDHQIKKLNFRNI
jgi:hypothetical protein